MTLTDVLEFKLSLFFQTFLPERIKHFNLMRKIWRHTHIYMIISRDIDLTSDTRNFDPQMLSLSYSLKEMEGMHYLLIKIYFTLHSNFIHQFIHTFRRCRINKGIVISRLQIQLILNFRYVLCVAFLAWSNIRLWFSFQLLRQALCSFCIDKWVPGFYRV